MKMTLFEVGKKAVFPQFVQHSAVNIDVSLACILGVDQDIIQVNNHENVKFFGEDLIHITLEVGWCVQ